MLILGLDATSVTASVAVADIDEGIVKKYSVFTVKTELKHSENLMQMIDNALKQYGADIKDVELFAVTSGPGSFTGVRIGVTTVKGMAFANNIPCADISSLEAVAYSQSTRDVICPLMDARRGQFYYALFQWNNGTLERITEDLADSAENISLLLNSYENAVVCGDGAYVFKNLYSGNCNLFYAKDSVREQNALAVALCGYEKYKTGAAIACERLNPVYLRPSQAERTLKEN